MLRRIGVLVSLAVVAAMSMGVSSASAQVPEDNVECTFDGLLRLNTEPIPPVFDPRGITQPGPYDLTANGACSGEVNGTIYTAEPVHIASTGDYLNYCCSTGWFWDYDGRTIVTIPSDGTVISDLGYEIKFEAGNGDLQIGGISKNPHGGRLGGSVGGNWTGAGAVHIEPVNPNGCITEPVDEFVVSGSFAAVRP